MKQVKDLENFPPSKMLYPLGSGMNDRIYGFNEARDLIGNLSLKETKPVAELVPLDVDKVAKEMYEICCYPDPTPFENINESDKKVWIYRAGIFCAKFGTSAVGTGKQVDSKQFENDYKNWLFKQNYRSELEQASIIILRDFLKQYKLPPPPRSALMKGRGSR